MESSIQIQIQIQVKQKKIDSMQIRLYLTLSLTGVGPFGPSLTFMEFALKVLKIRYRQKLGIPQAGS
jgi:hypothetical protein